MPHLRLLVKSGVENINARTVAKKLNCSTQPVMYHFETIEELKKATYAKADRFHTEYLMNIKEPQEGIMLGNRIKLYPFCD